MTPRAPRKPESQEPGVFRRHGRAAGVVSGARCFSPIRARCRRRLRSPVFFADTGALPASSQEPGVFRRYARAAGVVVVRRTGVRLLLLLGIAPVSTKTTGLLLF